MLYLVWKKKKKYFYVIINLESETKIETIFQSTYGTVHGGNGLVVHLLGSSQNLGKEGFLLAKPITQDPNFSKG